MSLNQDLYIRFNGDGDISMDYALELIRQPKEEAQSDAALYQAIETNYLVNKSEMSALGFPVINSSSDQATFHGTWNYPGAVPCGPGEEHCCRCSSAFDPIKQAKTLESSTECCFHPERLDRRINSYPCCKQGEYSRGCTTNNFHVWTGVKSGMNGPFPVSYFKRFPNAPIDSPRSKVYAIDCEMCFTARGLEVTNVSVVNLRGDLVYQAYIQPIFSIIDYNTRFSGITPEILAKSSVLTLSTVQRELMSFIDSETILVGHAIHNDLRALRFQHEKIVDTSVLFEHPRGQPYRLSLKSLVERELKRSAQSEETGHSSYEDSRDCIDLLLQRIRKDQEKIHNAILSSQRFVMY